MGRIFSPFPRRSPISEGLFLGRLGLPTAGFPRLPEVLEMLFTWFSLSFCASWGKLRQGFSDVIYLFLRQTCDSVVYPVRLFITDPCGSRSGLLASTLCPEPRDYVSE